jgi:hypothetical protein
VPAGNAEKSMITSKRIATNTSSVRFVSVTGEGRKFASTATIVSGACVPSGRIRLRFQVFAGPVLRMRKRYLRRRTVSFGWILPLTTHLSPPGAPLPTTWKTSLRPFAAGQKRLSVRINGMSVMP